MVTLKRLWRAWRAFGLWMADRVGRLVMTIFYFSVAAPFGIAVRMFGDPLRLKRRAPLWEVREQQPQSLDESRRAF